MSTCQPPAGFSSTCAAACNMEHMRHRGKASLICFVQDSMQFGRTGSHNCLVRV
ncbi:hypothetical protein DL98DRAFT_515927 [Cadophora sp. DSE1049]|nr:hypothetical protein DL98DRAFT_515927 [Cadophora sp. DSE1049]